jgi:hypothetical protein
MSKRPGGLTALAVLNFVFGGLGAIFLLGLIALITAADKVSGGEVSKAPGAGQVYLVIALAVVSVILMITAGVGYIQQKKFLGKTLGNAYGVLALGRTALEIALLDAGFGVGTIIGLIYPVLTLILLNTTFKDDFIR